MQTAKATEAALNEQFMTLLRRHRMAVGLSQTDLAKKLKLKSSSTISFWESGEKVPSPKLIPKLARILRIDAMALMKVIEPDSEKPVAAK